MKDNNDNKLSIFQFEGARYKTKLTEKFENRTPWEPDDPHKVYAVIPGTVVKISVKEGQKVNKGRALYILEAMKMKNRIISDTQGVVEKIYIEEGQKISKNELVLEFVKNGDKRNSKTSQRSRKNKKT